MPVETIRLGPFEGGLNTFSDPTSIGDTEVAQLINLECDIDGSLVSRPPIVDLATPISASPTAALRPLGWYEASTGAKYLVCSDNVSSTYYFTGTTWTLITNTIAAAAVTQYRDELWLVAPVGSANPGGKWTPGAGFTAYANMPKGGCTVTFKDRIWIGPGAGATSNGSRLYLSNIVSNAVDWPAVANYLQIGSGDGQNIIDLAVYQESILVFKRGSTYRYAFTSDPSAGAISRISDNIGAVSKGCWASYQDDLYVLFDNKLYQFTNYRYNQLNLKVPFVANNPSAGLTDYYSVSVWANRVFVQFYDVTYVYSMNTRSWSVWDSTVCPYMGRVFAIPGEQGTLPKAYTYTANSSDSKSLYSIVDAVTAATEPISCKVTTKNYDYLNSMSYKRLVSWGADLISKVAVTSKVTPITYGATVTWDYLKNNGITWGSLKDGGFTWDRLIDKSVSVTDTVSTAGSASGRKYVKFPKSTRGRQFSFEITATTMGDTTTAPVRIFNIMTRVAEKQDVSKRVS